MLTKYENIGRYCDTYKPIKNNLVRKITNGLENLIKIWFENDIMIGWGHIPKFEMH